jgi:hypothetical protein
LVLGIVTKPYQEVKKQGPKGIFTGAIKGISGLIVKPVAGVLDATAKTAEGLKVTALLFDDKPNEQRLRVPRAFYEKEGYIKSYNFHDSEVIHILHTYRKGKYKDSVLFDSFFFNSPKTMSGAPVSSSVASGIAGLGSSVGVTNTGSQGGTILILTYESIMLFSRRNLRLEWEFNPALLDKAERRLDPAHPFNEELLIVVQRGKDDGLVRRLDLSEGWEDILIKI